MENIVNGRIFLKETGEGLPNLLVEVYTKDIKGVIENLPPGVEKPLYRLGSALTTSEGNFSVSFEDMELPEDSSQGPGNTKSGAGRRWLNLHLEVKTAAEPDKETETQTVYVTSLPREQASRNEQFLIGITRQQLEAAGGSVIIGYKVEDFTTALITSITREDQLKKQVRQVLKDRVDKGRLDEQNKKINFLTPFYNSISKVPKALRDSERNFVKEGDSVEAKTKENIIFHLQNVINDTDTDKHPKSKGIVHLSAEQKAAYFKDEYKKPDGTYELPEDVSKTLLNTLFKKDETGEAGSVSFTLQHPLEKLCREKSAPEKSCLVALGLEDENTNTPSPDNNTPTTNSPVPADAERDVPLYIAKQMEYVVSPEGPVVFGVGNRATLEDIQNNVKNLNLRVGPADTPALYDFHSIQIAFEHVWQEAIDEGVLQLARNAYDEIIDKGGRLPAAKDDKIPMAALKEEARVIRKHMSVDRVDLQIPQVISEMFPKVTIAGVWVKLSQNQKKSLEDLAMQIASDKKVIKYANSFTPGYYFYQNRIKKSVIEGNTIIDLVMESMGLNGRVPPTRPGSTTAVIRPNTQAKVSAPADKEIHEIIDELEAHLNKDNYSFTTFAANENECSVNFGILLTYRQKWEPIAYQVGELVKTIPLAPKETRKYSKKTVVKKKRVVKEMENNLQILKTDSSQTGRAESEIIEKATMSTDYTRSSGAGGDVAVASSNTTTNFTGKVTRDSQEAKKSFRENVFKAAQEYKNERKVEIETERTYESEYTESGEIMNPNDEIPLTYLFFELQRQYKVTERLHRLRPVVFVAQPVPEPHGIDEEWLLRHDWILRRTLLDDSFVPALNFLPTITSDEFVLAELEKDLNRQRKLVDDLRLSYEMLRKSTETQYQALQNAIKKQAGVTEDPDVWDSLPIAGGALDTAESIIGGIGSILGFGGGDDEAEAARLRREAATDAYERAERQQKELLLQLKAESDKLRDLSDKYNQKLSDKLTKETLIARLRVHVVDNILHYMHAIWNTEHPDQRFFRLHKVQVPTLNGANRLIIDPEPLKGGLATHYQPGRTRHSFRVAPRIIPEFDDLVKVADLDTLLGFKGNYMIFPLKESNALTDYMMAPYIDEELGLKDPDEFGNWTLDEFSRYVCCLKKQLPAPDFEALIPELTEHYKKLLTDPLRQGEILVVPSGSLYMEAYAGNYSAIEGFKAEHRQLDVKKVQAEVRQMELENARIAARILTGELEDPNVDKKIVVEGNGQVFVTEGQ